MLVKKGMPDRQSRFHTLPLTMAHIVVPPALALASLGLLCMPIGVYDDSALLMGARLVRAGKLPYSDFYTHYGPFGYTIQALLLGAGEPGLALRLGQALLLIAVSVLAVALTRRLNQEAWGAWGGVVFVLVLTSTAVFASFYAFALAVASVVCFALAEGSGRCRAGMRWAAFGGALLATTALARPVFAAYILVAVASLQVVAPDAETGRRNGVIYVTTAGMSLFLFWTLLYRRISVGVALDATLAVPGRLMSGGSRYIASSFLRGPLPNAVLMTTTLAATTLVWAMGDTSRRTRLLAAICIVAGGLAPLWLRLSARPARDSAVVAGVILALTLMVAFVARAALRASAQLRSAALFGLAAAAFTHYFWVRQDTSHLLLFLTLATGSVGLAINRFQGRGRIAALCVLLFLTFASICPDTHLIWRLRLPYPGSGQRNPIRSLWGKGGHKLVENLGRPGLTLRSVWPCGEMQASAVEAVSLADHNADPTSRFVAAGSSQDTSDFSPVVLFLLSSRLPYTKWYTYDPELQTSARIQTEMVRELELSGSQTAVVWRTNEEKNKGASARCRLDAAFDHLYPTTTASFGDYQVRSR